LKKNTSNSGELEETGTPNRSRPQGQEIIGNKWQTKSVVTQTNAMWARKKKKGRENTPAKVNRMKRGGATNHQKAKKTKLREDKHKKVRQGK